MNSTEKNSTYSRELHQMLMLRYEPIAVKLIENEPDVPEHAIRPRRDMKKHLALCQAFAMARRDKKTIYMEKHDHWCWNPLIGLGSVDCGTETESFGVVCRFLGIADIDAAREFFANFPRLPLNKYQGILVAPLSECMFEPDVTLIYANNAQLRSMVWAIKHMTGKLVETPLDAIDSCVWSLVPTVATGEYRVTLPDVGEHERAMAEEGEIILSVPGHRMNELITGLHFFYDRHMGYIHHTREMELDFKRPPFYNTLFEMWGLDKGEDWGK